MSWLCSGGPSREGPQGKAAEAGLEEQPNGSRACFPVSYFPVLSGWMPLAPPVTHWGRLKKAEAQSPGGGGHLSSRYSPASFPSPMAISALGDLAISVDWKGSLSHHKPVNLDARIISEPALVRAGSAGSLPAPVFLRENCLPSFFAYLASGSTFLSAPVECEGGSAGEGHHQGSRGPPRLLS